MQWNRSIGRLAVACALLLAALPAAAQRHPLTIDDVFAIETIDAAEPSPDGEWIAVAVQRPAAPGEVYGRTFYEFDPGRADIWLVSRRTGEKRNLTNGARDAAGFWCPAWSPDGRRLAMLSTQPEGKEPRGGDNVRLYVWERGGERPRRMGDAAVATQSRTTYARLDLRGGAGGGTRAHGCHFYENAPFAWLDAEHLLAIGLPVGAVSTLVDEHSRSILQAGRVWQTLRDGAAPTFTAVGSGAERLPADPANAVVLRRIDAAQGTSAAIATLPHFPFGGELSVAISPDTRRAAVLTSEGMLQPAPGQRIPNASNDDWTVERRLGFVDIAPDAVPRWVTMPDAGRLPLQLFGWSPDGRAVALRARRAPGASETPLFLASAADLAVTPLGLSAGDGQANAWWVSNQPVLWAGTDRLLALTSDGKRRDWWLAAPGTAPVNLTAGAAEVPDQLYRTADGRFVGLAGGKLVALDVARRALEPLPAPPGLARVTWPFDADAATRMLIVADAKHQYALTFDGSPAGKPFDIGPRADLVAADPAHGFALVRDPQPNGTFLREAGLAGGASSDRLALDAHLARIDWGAQLLIDYRDADGALQKASVILPPDYKPGRRYPVITWVYPGYVVRDANGYFTDPYMPGIYNMQIYAARGYVVLIPSMPLPERPAHDVYAEIPKGVLPAIDKLVERGIADPDRVGVMGQSFGGYATYALVTQTNRFRAAIAMAGITDLVTYGTAFDPGGRGYPGIEHERSQNWEISSQSGIAGPAYEDYARAWRNSPLAWADRTETPLLMIHGEYDERGQMAQAEAFFSTLYRQGKTAKLLRYWGENHGLALSPANERSIEEQILDWFDKYLAAKPKP